MQRARRKLERSLRMEWDADLSLAIDRHLLIESFIDLCSKAAADMPQAAPAPSHDVTNDPCIPADERDPHGFESVGNIMRREFQRGELVHADKQGGPR